ncbi:MAG: hypothetical protein R3A10_12720 [Caldilineaceae bacterium]
MSRGYRVGGAGATRLHQPGPCDRSGRTYGVDAMQAQTDRGSTAWAAGVRYFDRGAPTVAEEFLGNWLRFP